MPQELKKERLREWVKSAINFLRRVQGSNGILPVFDSVWTCQSKHAPSRGDQGRPHALGTGVRVHQSGFT